MQFDILSMLASIDKIPALSTEYMLIIYAVCIIVLTIGSITDFRKREVLDYLSYFLIFASLGIRCIYSFVLSDYHIILSGIIGLLIFLAMSVMLYYTGQWGGGDSKVLMGLGAAIGFYLPQNLTQSAILSQGVLLDFLHHGILRYVLLVLLFGALYTVIWSIVLAILNFKKVSKEFKINFCFLGPLHIIQDLFSGSIKKSIPEEKNEIILGDIGSKQATKLGEDKTQKTVNPERYNKMSYARLFLYILFIVSGIVFLFSEWFIRNIIIFFVVTFALLYLLVIVLKSIENASMMLTVGIDKIAEGEWISQDYFLKKRKQETLGEFFERKICDNVVLTIPFTLKGKKDFDEKVAEETRDQLIESEKEMEKIIFTYSHSKILSFLRSLKYISFKHSKEYPRYAGYIRSLLDAKDRESFDKLLPKIRKYNKDFDYEILFSLFNFRYDLEYIGGPSQLGIDLEGIDILKKTGVKFVQIRQGVPFVPSFFLAFIFFLIL